jgi:hypothetical protein
MYRSLFKDAAQISLTFSKKYLLPETTTNINHSQQKPPPGHTALNVMFSCSNFLSALMNKISTLIAKIQSLKQKESNTALTKKKQWIC